MLSEAEYRAEAAQLARQSETARNDAHRTALLQQADTLLRMAVIATQMEQIFGSEDRMEA
jgi:hypothetical protein